MLPCCSLHTFNTVWLGIKPLYLTVLSIAGFHYSVTIHAGHGYNTTGTLYVTLHGSWGDTGVMQVTEWVTNTLSTMLSSCHPFLFVSDDVCTLIWRISLRKSLTYFLTTVVRLSTMQCHPFVSRQRWCRSNNFVIQLNTQFCRNTDTFADINSLMSLHATRQGTLDYSHLSSRSHSGMILAYKVEIGVHELISALKKKKEVKRRRGMNRQTFPQSPRKREKRKKKQHHHIKAKPKPSNYV